MVKYWFPILIIGSIAVIILYAIYKYKKERKIKESALTCGRLVTIITDGGKHTLHIDHCNYKNRTFVSRGIEYSMKRIVF